MIYIIELLYMKIYFLYHKFGESIPQIYATAITSLFLGFNFLSVLLIVDGFVWKTNIIKAQHSFVWVGFGSLILTIFYFHINGKASRIISKGNQFSKKENLTVLFYIIASLGLFLLLLLFWRFGILK